LIAGRAGQEYNQRKERKGAFWEDRYHATAVDSGMHLIQCLVYIDLNMVRTGVVAHPQDWPYSGYHEIQEPRKRYGLIDHERLADLVEVKDQEALRKNHLEWVVEKLNNGNTSREDHWTDSIAVGGETFVQEIQRGLGAKAIGRAIVVDEEQHQLREVQQPYMAHLNPQKGSLRQENDLKWKSYDDI